ncbi:hypothetical protein M5_0181 [Lysinibacillus phage vB_LfM_LysYB2]|nr:hypothetical protein M5_0181 [Lysinibacillus phage vB_LfM_LysYB2]
MHGMNDPVCPVCDKYLEQCGDSACSLCADTCECEGG